MRETSLNSVTAPATVSGEQPVNPLDRLRSGKGRRALIRESGDLPSIDRNQSGGGPEEDKMTVPQGPVPCACLFPLNEGWAWTHMYS
ncbi:hypothetical protein KU6B_25460 [Mameliella alba]|nr:hypothetical protein KU6B_25460 [Mameliella alba]